MSIIAKSVQPVSFTGCGSISFIGRLGPGGREPLSSGCLSSRSAQQLFQLARSLNEGESGNGHLTRSDVVVSLLIRLLGLQFHLIPLNGYVAY